MSVSQAIRYVPAAKTAIGALYINCHVKPNARQGSRILSINDEVVELAVSAQARDGEANKAVVELLASALKAPKSDIEVVRGMKSREKAVKVDGSSLAAPTGKGESKLDATEYAATIVWRAQHLLEAAVEGE